MYRVDNILKDPWYNKCLEHNAAWERERRFCRHDLQHMLDVARITYMLMLEDGCLGKVAAIGASGKPLDGKEIIYAAGLLHDMGRWVQYKTGEDHAVAGARMAGPVLDRAGFDAAEKEIITTAIREHRTGGPAASPLGRYICRADDLARPCSRCAARADCYKIDRMETARLLLY
ncbi:HD domain-containing protein [Desulfoscipio geothermicus DSM 3669]|uniref:HD domain-containing protein n=1 Tax=Desulfoscipio geothermicus DSM 3669 TaxID=1121426 RepID=A0A1I6DUV5_9FIRM|nr:HD domain-containing protein [Desulfoscipio geothermicus DSM 3669]